MSKHNAKVAAKRAKVTLKTVSKQKKQMGLLWRRAYEMSRRHRMRRAFRAWRGPRACDLCCAPPYLEEMRRFACRQTPRRVGSRMRIWVVFVRYPYSSDPTRLPRFVEFVGAHRRDDRAVLVGLHPCGDLSCALLRLFVRGVFKECVLCRVAIIF